MTNFNIEQKNKELANLQESYNNLKHLHSERNKNIQNMKDKIGQLESITPIELPEKQDENIKLNQEENKKFRYFTIPDSRGCFNPAFEQKEKEGSTYYEIDEKGNVYLAKDAQIKRAINRCESYLKPAWYIENENIAESANGVIVKKLPKIDLQTGIISEKGLMEFTTSGKLEYVLDDIDNKAKGTEENKEIKNKESKITPMKFFGIPEPFSSYDLDSPGRFDMEYASDSQNMNSFYFVDKDNNLYINETPLILRGIENIENYLTPACEIQNFSYRGKAKGVKILEPGKIDNNGKIIKKVKIELILENKVISEFEKNKALPEKENIEKEPEEIRIPKNAIYFGNKHDKELDLETTNIDNARFAIFNISNNTADVAYVGKPINTDYFETEAKFSNNPYEVNIKNIKTISPGKAVFENGKWKIMSPFKLFFSSKEKEENKKEISSVEDSLVIEENNENWTEEDEKILDSLLVTIEKASERLKEIEKMEKDFENN